MPRSEDVDRSVLEYLEAHPSAADTLEGIAEWWLAQRRTRYGVEMVGRALERLIRSGQVEVFRRRDDREPLFRLRPSGGLRLSKPAGLSSK